LGLRNSAEAEKLLRKAIRRGRPPKQNLMYVNFWRRLCRKPHPRRGLYEMFGSKPWVTQEGGDEHVPIRHFYHQMASHTFILSPPGAGDDCHRHWESILLGSIPIVKRSSVTRILDGLPCLQVDDWGEVTEVRLQEERIRLEPLFHSPRMKVIWLDYWKKRIMEA
jgi:hypothetical protein